jgi:hypothetical protein
MKVYLVLGGMKEPIAIFDDSRDAEDYQYSLRQEGCEGEIRVLSLDEAITELQRWETMR